jgi:dTDP-4-dehydrorhamnose reductase
VKVMITGATGQVGGALLRSAPATIECVAPSREIDDLTNEASIAGRLDSLKPSVVVNAAAYTAVDKAESDRDAAFAANARGVAALASACRERGIRLIHISTDFVFDGTASRPYRIHDAVCPLNVYGESKLGGETAIRSVEGLHWLIVRTAWVYASTGRNFVLTMLKLFNERDAVNVVSDQIGTPTSAASVARCIWKAVEDTGPSALLHFTDAGVASWYDFAVAIAEEALAIGLLKKTVRIVPIATEQYPTPARRPSFSVLDKRETLERLQLPSIHWRVALRSVLREIKH